MMAEEIIASALFGRPLDQAAYPKFWIAIAKRVIEALAKNGLVITEVKP